MGFDVLLVCSESYWGPTIAHINLSTKPRLFRPWHDFGIVGASCAIDSVSTLCRVVADTAIRPLVNH